MADTQLDTLHANTPALGDEQVLDVELDRNTVFRHVPPPKQGLDPWNLDSESQPAPVKPAPTLPSVFPNSAVPTRRTLICSLFFVCLFFYRIYHSPWLTCPGVSVNFTRFGMYINFHQVTELPGTDLKGKSSSPLPYKPVSSAAQFRVFVPGRRKAIEVGGKWYNSQPLNISTVGAGTCPA
jgi:hypothetical protein